MELSTQELAELLHPPQAMTPGRATFTIPARPVIVRTVTHYYTGLLVDENDRWLYLDQCAWIADTGRWSTAVATGALNEVEPFPDGIVRVSVGAVIDVSDWNHPLPRTVK